MADAKIKKIKGNVIKLIFSRIYRKYVILTWKTASNSSNFIYIYDFNDGEWRNMSSANKFNCDVTLRHKQTIPR